MLKQVLWIQAAIVIACAAGWSLRGIDAAVAAGFGAGIALLQVLALMARARHAARVGADARGMIWMAALSFLERVVLIAVLMWLGLKVLALSPAPLLVGLVVGQIGFLWAGAQYRLR